MACRLHFKVDFKKHPRTHSLFYLDPAMVSQIAVSALEKYLAEGNFQVSDVDYCNRMAATALGIAPATSDHELKPKASGEHRAGVPEPVPQANPEITPEPAQNVQPPKHDVANAEDQVTKPLDINKPIESDAPEQHNRVGASKFMMQQFKKGK